MVATAGQYGPVIHEGKWRARSSVSCQHDRQGRPLHGWRISYALMTVAILIRAARIAGTMAPDNPAIADAAVPRAAVW
jgi:hypothetical protein